MNVVLSYGEMFNVYSNDTSVLNAKKEGRPMLMENPNGLFKCLFTGAMKFGDVNDKEAEITKLAADERMYHLLEHVGTKPNVIYQS
jgi:molybdopterin-containing oxidoreductase family iron-sulfur binding subunit